MGIKEYKVKKYIIIGVLIAFSFQTSAKGKWDVGLGSVIGYNTKELQLWKYTAKSTFSRGIYLKFGYKLSLGKKFSVSITPGVQQHRDIIELNETKVSGYSYNFDIPIDIHYCFLPKWSTHIGFSIQDYRALEDVALNKSYNARLNLNCGFIYHFSEIWAMELAYSRIVSDKIDSFLFRNYTNHVCLGVCMNLQILKKKNHD
ncbi:MULTISPECIES: hypothetical protein [unclassified Lentimicrobium]|uniref:hypothetical protein n=1 Tax=unclassified Lentimicrobium TaxID=2677434 RepID=UPI001551B730|nr:MULTISPECIES: hypothetical protein [unclassified Lentimicrobium]NPD46304.1 hypothetical protein [Lentimicrobium sp. S6]NPD85304.1 hypothetical protein [Lentimicrobium sp. L6]